MSMKDVDSHSRLCVNHSFDYRSDSLWINYDILHKKVYCNIESDVQWRLPVFQYCHCSSISKGRNSTTRVLRQLYACYTFLTYLIFIQHSEGLFLYMWRPIVAYWQYNGLTPIYSWSRDVDALPTMLRLRSTRVLPEQQYLSLLRVVVQVSRPSCNASQYTTARHRLSSDGLVFPH